ncbi:hypothetical protein A2U01_0069770, partial [Trifolium medium]|nr:hypothetical protein [Trifolium medium]
AYELGLPISARVHPVFHVSKLKPFKGTPPSSIPELDPAVIGPLVDVQPVAILATRAVTTENGAQQQALIHWSG